ncbi:MAG: hypothetical protein QM817_27985 [Archangium sp.]
MFKLVTFVAVASLALASLTGCAHRQSGAATTKQPNPAEVEKVQKRAEIDLGCNAVTVEVLQEGNMMNPWTFAAKGCDKSATYLARMGTIIRN